MTHLNSPNGIQASSKSLEIQESLDTKITKENIDRLVDEIAHLLKTSSEPIVLVNGWPPQSGKSVFYRSLATRFDRGCCFSKRACPDGEGRWSQDGDPDTAKMLRVKGDYLQDGLFDSYVSKIHEIKKDFRLILLDIGGRISPQNTQILSACSHWIVLCADNKLDQQREWEEYFREKNIKLIASFQTSIYEWSSRKAEFQDGVLRGSLFGLKRGDNSYNNPHAFVIDKHGDRQEAKIVSLSDVSSQIQTRIAHIVEGEQGPEDERRWLCIHIPSLLAFLRQQAMRDNDIYWDPLSHNDVTTWKSKDIQFLFSDKMRMYFGQIFEENNEQAIFLDGGAPIFIYAILACYLEKPEIFLSHGKNGRVEIFSPFCEDRDDSWILSLQDGPSKTVNEKLSIPTSILSVGYKAPFIPGVAFNRIPLPDVDHSRGLIVSGRIPIAVLAKIARYYKDKVPFVAIRTPQQSKDSDMKDPAMIVAGEGVGQYISAS